jgi:hypothetical protein
MRGRRPKPTRVKALTGNPGKRPLNTHEPRPEPAAPDCPPELSPAARQESLAVDLYGPVPLVHTQKSGVK